MKSDLIGGTKTRIEDLETATLYLDKKKGIVFLTDVDAPHFATIVHSVNKKYKVGRKAIIVVESHYDLLRGKIVLQND